jgi:hypothetical protein
MRIESELFLGSLKGRLAPLLKPDREQLTGFHSRNRESGIGNRLYGIIPMGLPDLPLDERRLMLMLVVVLGVGCRSVTGRCYSFLFRNQPSSIAFRLRCFSLVIDLSSNTLVPHPHTYCFASSSPQDSATAYEASIGNAY